MRTIIAFSMSCLLLCFQSAYAAGSDVVATVQNVEAQTNPAELTDAYFNLYKASDSTIPCLSSIQKIPVTNTGVVTVPKTSLRDGCKDDTQFWIHVGGKSGVIGAFSDERVLMSRGNACQIVHYMHQGIIFKTARVKVQCG